MSLSQNKAAQVRRLIEYVTAHQEGINRFEAVEKLSILHVAARKQDAEKVGYIFSKVTETANDSAGNPHDGVARYFLIGFKAPEKAEG